MNIDTVKNIIEAVLMVADCPLNSNQISNLFQGENEDIDKATIKKALAELAQDYAERGIELKELASGYRFQVRNEYSEWINRMVEEKPPRYSRALLETLAIIVYRQPVTRAEIEEIRGVSVSANIIKTLMERNWIKVVGHRNLPGKPELLASTRHFLDYFNVKHLSDLPDLTEIKTLHTVEPELFPQTEDSNTPSEVDNHDRMEVENTDNVTLLRTTVSEEKEDALLTSLDEAIKETAAVINNLDDHENGDNDDNNNDKP